MTESRAYFILNLLPKIGPRRAGRLITYVGSAVGVLHASEAELAECPGIGDEIAAQIHAWEKNTAWEQEWKLAEDEGVEIVTPADADYPARLLELTDAPLALYRKGRASGADRHALAVVGSRAASPYGLAVARKLSRQAASAGMPVVSGLARGIDTAAHEGALDAGGRTVAVLGGGLLSLYPRENAPLAERIVAGGGCLLSEFPLRRAPDKQTFAIRNRIVAGMTRATLVVEAPRHSGALITAGMAREMGREVLAVPGRIDTPHASGCHDLIKTGARLVTEFSDILDLFGELFSTGSAEEALSSDSSVSNRSEVGVILGPEELRIVDYLGKKGPSDPESIVANLGIPVHVVNVNLSRLELKGLISVNHDGTYEKIVV